ncbi:MAG: Gfo/Idh/MocA family oxidoreductase [Candidatus Latescibacteria bacterium]|jgi:myo-inositol 2-dehydrogenase / D-chiro-inositol 1-dehydrogenase|nr:Gfo/Idh/MocA family oxidoreductase [Candidatus Latescibacterota bacterium]
MSQTEPVRVGIYGTGTFANGTHIPNIIQFDNVVISAVCDADPKAASETAAKFSVKNVFTDAHKMLAEVKIDALYSIVPAFARTDVESTAARMGIHLFSEKPQALDMKIAMAIDEAVAESGVISTVGFRERYRPIFQEARRLLEGKRIVHIRFQQISGPPPKNQPIDRGSWGSQMKLGGVRFFDWGVHATDYTRFMTGLDITKAQAFLCHPEEYQTPLSSSFHYALSNGATATLTFIEADPAGLGTEAYFTIHFEGGRIKVFGYERIELNDEVVYEAEPFDPWLAQDRTFIEAVRSGNRKGLLSDYHDGLFSLAPILAGWESTRQNGACIDVGSLMV